MVKGDNELSALFGGLVLRLRHAKMLLLQEVDRLDAAIAALASGPGEERVAIPEKVIEGKVSTVRKIRSKPMKGKAGMEKTKAVRMAVVKLKEAATAEIADFVRRMGIEITNSTASAFLSLGRKAGEYVRSEAGKWRHTGGVIAKGTAEK